MLKSVGILDREIIQNFAEAGVVTNLISELASLFEHSYRRGCREAAADTDAHAIG